MSEERILVDRDLFHEMLRGLDMAYVPQSKEPAVDMTALARRVSRLERRLPRGDKVLSRRIRRLEDTLPTGYRAGQVAPLGQEEVARIRETFQKVVDNCAASGPVGPRPLFDYTKESEHSGSVPVEPQARPVFDITTLRQDPQNDRRIREYSDRRILVPSRDMIETVKADFEARGWIYGGNHYGDGSVMFQVVLDSDDKVVDPADVLAALQEIGVHHIQRRRSEPLGDEVEDAWDDGEQIEDRRPASVAEVEAERQAAMEAAMEAEEEAVEPGTGSPSGVLQLQEGEAMRISWRRAFATSPVELTLEIGQDVIRVLASYMQAARFLAEATTVYTGVLAARVAARASGVNLASHGLASIEEAGPEGKVKEQRQEVESDGETGTETDELPEQG